MSFTYKGLKAVKKRHVVTPQEVDDQLEHLVESRPRLIPITDRKSRNGDQVVLDYAGFCDGEQFQGGTAQNQTLVLGSGTFIPGFEEQLVDHNVGDDVTVKVTFPKEYHAPNLAGKEAEFRCTIHAIQEKSHYHLDEVFAKEVGQCDTVEQMKEKMGRSMQYYQDEQAEIQLQDGLLNQASMTLDMELSQKDIDEAVEEQLQGMAAQLQQQGLSLDMYCQFTGKTQEQLRQEAVPHAQESLRIAATIERIVALEGLKADQKEIDRAREHIANRNGITLEELNAMNDPNLDRMVERAVLTSKVMSIIRDGAEVTEE